MDIPRFWVRISVNEVGIPVQTDENFRVFGWSNISMEEARKHGEARAKIVAQKINNRKYESLEHGYPYPSRPLLEQIIDENPQRGWAITRNGYGSLVLNTEDVMFVDIDVPAVPRWGWLGRFLNQYERPALEPHVQKTLDVMHSIPGLAGRLYQTAAGLRLMITSQTYDPASDITQKLLAKLGSDKQYNMLCKAQKSFRARLTPKYWRCKLKRPPRGYPFMTASDEQVYEKWLNHYELTCGQFGVCQLLREVPTAYESPAISDIVAIHDQHTLCIQGQTLA